MNNDIGIYYAFWTHDWDVDFVPYVGKVKQLGFDILEVNSGTVTNMSNEERDRLKQAAAEHGVTLTYCIGLPAEYDLASEDASVRATGIDFLKRQAEMVASMGGRQISGILYSYWPGALPKGVTDKRPFRDRSVASMKQVMQTAEDCGAQLNMEVVNRFEQYLLNTAAEAVDYVERVGSPNCRILLDTFHMNIEEDSFREAIVTAGDKLGHLHIGETNRRAPGRGKIPWREIALALAEIDFTGAVVMEPFLMTGGIVGENISVFRDLRGDLDLDQEAGRACAFMRQILAAV